MSYIGNSPGVASSRVTTTLTATAGQTVFTTQSGYVLGYVDVYLNGVKLVNGADFEAITGTYITLFAGALAGDVVELVSYIPRGLTDGYTKSEADAKFLDVGGDSATGSLSLTAATLSGALTLNGGTANGVTYLNNSKVLTSGSALTFDGTTLGTSGLTVSTNRAQFKGNTSTGFTGGSVEIGYTGTVGIVNAYDRTASAYKNLEIYGNDIYNYVKGSNAIWDIAGVGETMRLTSTGLGIGTSSPANKLSVYAGGIVANFGAYGTGAYDDVEIQAYSGSCAIGTRGSTPLLFNIARAEKMRLDISGNLGLGVTPSAWGVYFKTLQYGNRGGYVAGSTTSYSGNSHFAVGNNGYFDSVGAWRASVSDGGGATQYYQVAGTHRWNVAGAVTEGNLISFTEMMNLSSGGLNFPTVASGNGNISFDGSTFTIVSNSSSASMLFSTNSTERARITSTGQFLLGTAVSGGSGATNAKQIIQFPGAADNGLYIDDTRTDAGADNAIAFGRGANYIGSIDTDLTYLRVRAAGALVFASGYTERARITSTGNFAIGTTTADLRLEVDGGVSTTFTNCPINVNLVNRGTIAAGLGAGIAFSANYDNNIFTTYATISGIRENATSGNPAGALVFGVRDAGGGVSIERARFTSGGQFLVGNTTTSGGEIARFQTASGATSVGIIAATNGTSYLNFGDTSDANVGFIGYDHTNNYMNFRTNGAERVRILSNGKINIAGVSHFYTYGYANLTDTFYIDVPVENDNPGVANTYHIQASISHANWSGYGCLLDTWYNARGAVPASFIEQYDTRVITSGNGGSWTISKPTTGVLRITHNAGTYNAAGYYWIRVTMAS